MSKELTLINPDIGEGEIAAVSAFLRDEALPQAVFRPIPGGPQHLLIQAFTQYLMGANDSAHPLIRRMTDERGGAGLAMSAVCIGNATGALWALLKAVGASGGEVITTSLNYVGVVNAIVMAGATPRFVDIEEGSWCADPACVKRAIGKNTRAIILTHLNRYVDPAPYYEMTEAAGKEIPVIQDASLAIGSHHEGLKPGIVNIGRQGATVFSLTISKIISGLGGAMVTSHDAELLHRALTMAHQGVSLTDVGQIEEFGSNFKTGAMNAVIARENLKRADELIAKRRMLREVYDEGLAPLVSAGRIRLQELDDGAVVTHYGIVLPAEDFAGRAVLAKRLHEDHKIMLGLWHCHHRQRIYRELLGKGIPKLPRTDAVAERIAFLPFHTKLTRDDVGVVCAALEEHLKIQKKWMS